MTAGQPGSDAAGAGARGSPERPGQGEDPLLVRAIRRIARRIAARPYEVAVVLSPEGKKLLEVRGQRVRVSFTPEQRAALKDMAVVHNHPSGGSFSAWVDPLESRLYADIDFAACFRARSTWVVTPDRIFEMRPPPGGWSEEVYQGRIRPVVERVQADLTIQVANEMGQDPPPAWHSDIDHEIWLRVAPQTGLQYRWEHR